MYSVEMLPIKPLLLLLIHTHSAVISLTIIYVLKSTVK